ncbi:transposase [Trichonephila clavata]|uniref:Transposase n=1 Tax=Trichonephila clavata TaxID=2740835 RepID=A0A8X6J7W9_TRICU|nr:transposase [Trichonephila clavata]
MAFSKFLDPKNDISFKRIFGTEKNKDILIHFLNDILGFAGKSTIKDIEFLSTIQDPDIASKKQSIVDVLCRDENGLQVIVEMQVAKTKGFEKRAQYYAAKAYSRQADKESIVEKWVYFFKYADETSEEELEKIIGSDLIIKKAYEELNRFNWSEKEFIAYEQEIKRILDEQAVLAQKLDDATQKGILIGHEKGRAEGIKIGAEKGREEGEKQAKIAVAKNSLKAGVSIDVISEITGLSFDELQKLRN